MVVFILVLVAEKEEWMCVCFFLIIEHYSVFIWKEIQIPEFFELYTCNIMKCLPVKTSKGLYIENESVI
jgi:hypothetical protein